MAASAGSAERADPVERIAEPVFLGFQVIPGLQMDPEPLGGAEEAGQPQRRVRADAALAVHDLVDPPGRDPDLLGQLVLAHRKRLEELLQQDLAWMHRCHNRVRRHAPSLLVVISDLYVLGPGVCPAAADPPLPVDPDAGPTGAIRRQLPQPVPRW